MIDVLLAGLLNTGEVKNNQTRANLSTNQSTLTSQFNFTPNPSYEISGYGKGWCWKTQTERLTSRCGGGGEGAKDISCSPFYYRPFQAESNDPSRKTGCGKGDGGYFDIVTGAGDNQGARAWASYPKKSDYWVFHNCDGAGIQPDCFGDVVYIERFEGSNNTKPGCYRDKNGRNHCTFTHPNSGSTFGAKKYWAGWFTNNGRISKSDCQAGGQGGPIRPWGGKNDNICNNITGLPNPYEGLPGLVKTQYFGGTFSFLLFPWVCEQDNSMVTDNFSSPSMDTYGVKNGWKCYADNEPGKQANGDMGWPPEIEIYFAGLFRESNGNYVIKFDKWMITSDHGENPVQIGRGYAIYPCSDGRCPW